MYAAVASTMLNHRIKVVHNRLVLELRPRCIGQIVALTAKRDRSELLDEHSCLSRG